MPHVSNASLHVIPLARSSSLICKPPTAASSESAALLFRRRCVRRQCDPAEPASRPSALHGWPGMPCRNRLRATSGHRQLCLGRQNLSQTLTRHFTQGRIRRFVDNDFQLGGGVIKLAVVHCNLGHKKTAKLCVGRTCVFVFQLLARSATRATSG